VLEPLLSCMCGSGARHRGQTLAATQPALEDRARRVWCSSPHARSRTANPSVIHLHSPSLACRVFLIKKTHSSNIIIIFIYWGCLGETRKRNRAPTRKRNLRARAIHSFARSPRPTCYREGKTAPASCLARAWGTLRRAGRATSQPTARGIRVVASVPGRGTVWQETPQWSDLETRVHADFGAPIECALPHWPAGDCEAAVTAVQQ
jgi:hypothetical protein